MRAVKRRVSAAKGKRGIEGGGRVLRLPLGEAGSRRETDGRQKREFAFDSLPVLSWSPDHERYLTDRSPFIPI